MDYAEKDFGKILKRNAQELRHDNLPLGTDCMRVYDRNLEEYPVTVDLYGKLAKVTDFGQSPMDDDRKASCLATCARMLYLQDSDVVYAYRAKRPEGEQHEKTDSEALKTVVTENGLSFEVDLTTYVDTGLFLDLSGLRKLVMENCQGKSVLNLFSYTGSFSVYAAAGLARTVTSVDMSATYTRWAQENLARNGYNGASYSCVCMDAGKFVREAVEAGRKYDIIIFDPPSFSNSHRMEHDFDVARDWAEWVSNLSLLLAKGGVIVFSTNLSSFRMDRRKVRGLKAVEVTSRVKAPGFVKGRMGTARSWIMAFDDDSLTLDWSEPQQKGTEEKKTSEGDGAERRRYDRKPSYGREGGDRRSYGDRPHYNRDNRDGGERRSYGDRSSYSRPRYNDREEGDRPRYGRNEWHGNDHREDGQDRRSYGDRPRYNRDGDDRRSYGDRPRYNDQPRYGRNEWHGNDRRDDGDRPSYGSSKPYSERKYSDRSENRYNSHRENGDRPRYARRDDGERRQYDRKPSYDRDRRPREEGPGYVKQNRDHRGSKPYGYDSFRPARSRNDNSDFFWNSNEKDNKDVD